jgi:DNA-binding NarL/FixJ family response regulator
MPKTIKLLLVDDHPIVLTGIKTCLRHNKRMRVVGQATTGAEAVQRAKTLRPDIILLDIGLPDVKGTEIMKMLRSALPTAKILIHTIHDDRELIREFINLGAKGYLLKGASPAQISRAIEAVNRGKTYFSPQVSEILNELGGQGLASQRGSSSPGQKPKYGLTPKEREILGYVVQGLRMREVATRVSLKYNTLTTHFKHIYRKLGVHTRGAVVAKTLRENIL